MGCSGSNTLGDDLRKRGFRSEETYHGDLAISGDTRLIGTHINTNEKLMIYIKRIDEYGNPKPWTLFDIPNNGQLIGEYPGHNVYFNLVFKNQQMFLSIQNNPRQIKLLLDKETSLFYENHNWTFICKLSICVKTGDPSPQSAPAHSVLPSVPFVGNQNAAINEC